MAAMRTGRGLLCECLTLALQKIVASLGALQLRLHQPQRLARGEDGFSRLRVVSVVLQHSFLGATCDVPRCLTWRDAGLIERRSRKRNGGCAGMRVAALGRGAAVGLGRRRAGELHVVANDGTAQTLWQAARLRLHLTAARRLLALLASAMSLGTGQSRFPSDS